MVKRQLTNRRGHWSSCGADLLGKLGPRLPETQLTLGCRLQMLVLASCGFLKFGQPLRFSYSGGNAQDSWREQNMEELVFFFITKLPLPEAKSQSRPSCISSRQEGRGDSEAHRILLYKLMKRK